MAQFVDVDVADENAAGASEYYSSADRITLSCYGEFSVEHVRYYIADDLV